MHKRIGEGPSPVPRSRDTERAPGPIQVLENDNSRPRCEGHRRALDLDVDLRCSTRPTYYYVKNSLPSRLKQFHFVMA
jgi:hypothetical protein